MSFLIQVPPWPSYFDFTCTYKHIIIIDWHLLARIVFCLPNCSSLHLTISRSHVTLPGNLIYLFPWTHRNIFYDAKKYKKYAIPERVSLRDASFNIKLTVFDWFYRMKYVLHWNYIFDWFYRVKYVLILKFLEFHLIKNTVSFW